MFIIRGEKMKKQKIEQIIQTKWFHILLIFLGTIFIFLGAFHTELWFDESYTIALIRHDIGDLIHIAIGDVHPILYYLLLKLVTMIFGESILVCRLFSMIAGVLLGLLGYTHIRKDFGEKVGLVFSFLMFFLPFITMYGIEIRMYTWTILFTTLAGIYSYRSIKNNKQKNWILFAISSLAAAHCHYYGLVAVAIINLLMFLHIIFSKKMYQENNITKKKYLINFVISALIEIIGYLPWLFVFLKQATAVSQGYWIPLNITDTVIAPLGVQFNGRLSVIVTAIFTIIMYIYLIYQIIYAKKKKQNLSLIWYCLLVHFILYFSMLIVTVLIKPIMYYRYMLITTGILIFPFAYFIANSKEKHQKIISSVIILIVLGLGIYNNSIVIRESYHNTNKEEVRYIEEQYKKGDMLLYADYFHGTNIAVQMPEYAWYLYNIDPSHNVKPFENFSPPIEIIFEEEVLANYKGRIILIDHENLQFYEEIKSKYEIKELARKRIRPHYRGDVYQIITIEK